MPDVDELARIGLRMQAVDEVADDVRFVSRGNQHRVSVFASLICMPAYAASGDVAGAIEGTWQTASQQIKTVVDHVVFPAIDLILAAVSYTHLDVYKRQV